MEASSFKAYDVDDTNTSTHESQAWDAVDALLAEKDASLNLRCRCLPVRWAG